IIEIGLIGKVEGLGDKLERGVGTELDSLGQREVVVLFTRGPQLRVGSWPIPKGEIVGLGEGLRIEPAFSGRILNPWIYSGNEIDPQVADHSSTAIEKRAEDERRPTT
ncbi:MAG: hypothetical protein ACK559_24865, partial [bacterium]